MTNLKLASMLVAAALGLATTTTITLPAHAGTTNPVGCTAGPCGGGNPNNPGNPDNPGDNDGGKPPTTGSFVPTGVPLIDCKVAKLPKPATQDLKFRNFGSVAIPAGTRVYWIVSETRDHGFYVLPNDLAPGKELLYADVLPTAAPQTDHCWTKIMQ